MLNRFSTFLEKWEGCERNGQLCVNGGTKSIVSSGLHMVFTDHIRLFCKHIIHIYVLNTLNVSQKLLQSTGTHLLPLSNV